MLLGGMFKADQRSFPGSRKNAIVGPVGFLTQRQRHIFNNRKPFQQCRTLEKKAELPPQPFKLSPACLADCLAGNQNAALVWRKKADHVLEGYAFACSGKSDDDEGFAFFNGEVSC